MCNLSTTLLIVGVITLYMCHIIYTKDVWLLVKYIILLSQKKKNIYIYIYIILCHISFWEKLQVITLNYTLNYTLHHKLLECILNYDPCYTLHIDIKFAINFNGKLWHNVKRPNCPSS